MSLARLPLIIRFVFLLLVFSVPFCLAGGLIAGWRGALAGFVVSDLLILALGISSERILIRAFGASRCEEAGVKLSFDSVIHGIEIEWGGFTPITRPVLFVYPDPVPNSATVRAIGGSGAVLVSQGLLSQLAESELRSVLRAAVLRIEEPEWVFSSLCAAIASLFFGAAPSPWVSLFFSAQPDPSDRERLSPSSLIFFFCLFPWIRFWLGLSARIPPDEGSDESWASAMRKIATEIRPGARVRVPAATQLYLIDPSPATQLVTSN